jgi:hypothetical protein
VSNCSVYLRYQRVQYRGCAPVPQSTCCTKSILLFLNLNRGYEQAAAQQIAKRKVLFPCFIIVDYDCPAHLNI